MLAEKLAEIGCRVVQANTDGVFVVLKKDVYTQVYNICREWEQLTCLVLEEKRFESMFQYAINDYIAVKCGYNKTRDSFLAGLPTIRNKKSGELYKSLDDIQKDYIEKKGVFITEVKLGKGLSPKIIPEAIIKYFVDGTPVEDTVKNCTDIRKFLMSEKTGKQWTVEYMNEEQQRTNRFYASTNGGYLWKWKDTGHKEGEIITYTEPYVGEHKYKASARQYQNMLTASGVTLLNKFDDKPIEERKINYRYYIYEAYKIIRELKPLQLSLWD